MTGRVQTLRSNVAGNRPTGRAPGELYVNWADAQIGVINPANAAQDLIAVRFFSTAASYVIGDFVTQGGQLYRAVAPSAPGVFKPANWGQIGGSITAGDAAPATPQPGTLWWDSVGGQLYVWYQDANTSQWVAASNAVSVLATGYLPLVGGTLTGPLTLAGNPAAALQAVPKQYVDALPVASNMNRIINGDMRIDQRNNGAAGTAVQTYTVDRWRYGATQATKGTWQRFGPGAVSLQVTGFPYALSFTSSSAYAALAGDAFYLQQRIEADMVSDFAWGTPSAQPVTLSFWANSSLTGLFSGSIGNDVSTRSYPFSYTINAANTWEKKSITIPGDTAGAWVMSGNALAVAIDFDLGSGSNFRGIAGAWAAANYLGVTGAVNVIGTNAATFYITGVKLEVGTVATPFVTESSQKRQADCERYYEASSGLGIFLTTLNTTAGNWVANVYFRTAKRATPTISGVTGSPSAPNIGGIAYGGFNCNWPSGQTNLLTWNASAEL